MDKPLAWRQNLPFLIGAAAILFWNEVLHWQLIGRVPASLVFCAFIGLIFAVGYTRQESPVSRGFTGFNLTLGCLALYWTACVLVRGGSMDVAWQQAPIFWGILYTLALWALIARVDFDALVLPLSVVATLTVALRIGANGLLRLTQTPVDVRILHAESDVMAAVMVLVCALVYHRQFRKRALLWGMVIINLLVLLVTIKRTAIAGFLVSALTYALLNRKDPDSRRGMRILGVILGLGSLATGLALALSPILRRFAVDRLGLFSDSSAQWRWQAWTQVVDGIRQNPIFGQGPGIFWLPGYVDSASQDFVHNSYLALWKSGGLVALGLLAIAIAFSAAQAIRLWRHPNADEQRRGQISLILLPFVLMWSFFNMGIETVHQNFFFWLVLIWPFLGVRPSCGPASARPPLLARLVTVAYGVMALGLTVLPLLSGKSYELTIYSSQAGGKMPYGANSAASSLDLTPPEGEAAATYRWLLPQGVIQQGGLHPGQAVQVTYNHAPRVPVSCVLTSAAGNASVSLTSQSGGSLVQIFPVSRDIRGFNNLTLSNAAKANHGLVIESIRIIPHTLIQTKAGVLFDPQISTTMPYQISVGPEIVLGASGLKLPPPPNPWQPVELTWPVGQLSGSGNLTISVSPDSSGDLALYLLSGSNKSALPWSFQEGRIVCRIKPNGAEDKLLVSMSSCRSPQFTITGITWNQGQCPVQETLYDARFRRHLASLWASQPRLVPNSDGVDALQIPSLTRKEWLTMVLPLPGGLQLRNAQGQIKPFRVILNGSGDLLSKICLSPTGTESDGRVLEAEAATNSFVWKQVPSVSTRQGSDYHLFLNFRDSALAQRSLESITIEELAK